MFLSSKSVTKGMPTLVTKGHEKECLGFYFVMVAAIGMELA